MSLPEMCLNNTAIKNKPRGRTITLLFLNVILKDKVSASSGSNYRVMSGAVLHNSKEKMHWL